MWLKYFRMFLQFLTGRMFQWFQKCHFVPKYQKYQKTLLFPMFR
jgi:hypothetical protein